MALVDHRYGIAPLTGEWLVEHAVAALAYSTALADRLLGGRWVHAWEALSAGATVQRVAEAVGMDPSEVHMGCRVGGVAEGIGDTDRIRRRAHAFGTGPELGQARVADRRQFRTKRARMRVPWATTLGPRGLPG